jgi:CheY-like chemotaxis protein
MSNSAKHILVVDDDLHIRAILEQLLRAEGYRVTAVANGQEALQSLAAQEPPCFILLDLQMPGMDGQAFLREQARAALHPTVPIAVLSGNPPRPEELATWGVAAHLTKPVPVEALLEVIHRHC